MSNILIIGRSTLFTAPGGDTTQIIKTAEYLKILDVAVDIKLSKDLIDYSRYDLIHFFNIIRPDDILRHVNKINVPFVISTIFVDYTDFETKCRTGILNKIIFLFGSDVLEYCKAWARHFFNNDKISSVKYMYLGQKRSIKHIARRAKVLLPNSYSEYLRFSSKYMIEQKYSVIPNGIDENIFTGRVRPNLKFKDFVICVARVEGLKNQMNLIKAIKQTSLNLAIIGKYAPNHRKYYEECVKEAHDCERIVFINHISQNELAEIYLAAKVHVLPSWFETTGLVSLEAAMMKCNIVVSSKGDTREYFEGYAEFCDPNSVESIRSAIIRAYTKTYDPSFKEKILKEYTWKIAAIKTKQVYENVLDSI